MSFPLVLQVKEYEDKIVRLEKTVSSQAQEINKLKALVQNLDGKVQALDGKDGPRRVA